MGSDRPRASLHGYNLCFGLSLGILGNHYGLGRQVERPSASKLQLIGLTMTVCPLISLGRPLLFRIRLTESLHDELVRHHHSK